jgi:hypothetical protein
MYLSKLFLLSVFGLAACTGAADHDHADGADHSHEDHAQKTSAANADEVSAVDHNRFGHMSAIYLCGNNQLQTFHTDTETKLAFKDQKIDVTRFVEVVDEAFAGESFKGTFKGQPLFFRGKGYDASLKLGDEVIACEKISCIPLGGPH